MPSTVLRENGYLYRKDGATWFKASELGDEKDRVVIRENGRTTYFASDIAYFLNKLERGFERAIYVFGADHHGYVARLRAAATGLGEDPDRLEILLVQFAVLFRLAKKCRCRPVPANSSRCANCGKKSAPMPPGFST